MVGAVERQMCGFVFDERLEMNRPAPKRLDVGQRIGGMIQPQIHPRVLMLQE